MYMAVKTITIDLEAYEALRRRKRAGQSFSDVIKEHFRGGATGRVLQIALRDLPVDESTLDAVDLIVSERGRDVPAVPKL
jgi:predicted CopG family antitoxin